MARRIREAGKRRRGAEQGPCHRTLDLSIRPLTPNLWPALEDLFGERGAVGGCWCMYWRIGRSYRGQAARDNRAAFADIVRGGPSPGLLAFHEVLPVGWCQLTPRDDLPWLDRTWRLRRVDDLPVWSISCFYVRIGYRRRRISERSSMRRCARPGALARRPS